MYQQYFGLIQAPFALTPNTALYQALQPHQEAIEVLRVALEQGEGFIKVTGEVGTGKTLLCRKLLNEMGEGYQFAYLPNPTLKAEELYPALAAELEIHGQDEQCPLLIDRIHRCLIQKAQQSIRVVLVIDEAQVLSDESLEALRLLGNLESQTSKLLQIVLFAQPELDKRLSAEHLRQLRQRISFSYKLRTLDRDESASYLQHRLHLCGYRGDPLFSAKALLELIAASRGVPRLLNILAHKSLMLCYGQGQRQISEQMVRLAISDTEDCNSQSKSTSSAWWIAIMFVLLSAVVGLLYEGVLA